MTDPNSNKSSGTGTVTPAPLAMRSQTSGFNLVFEAWKGSEDLRLGAINFSVDCGPDYRNLRGVLYSLYHAGKLNLTISEISTPYSIVLGRFDKVDFQVPKSALTQDMPKGAHGVVIGSITGGQDVLEKISTDRTQKVAYTFKCTACTDSKRL